MTSPLALALRVVQGGVRSEVRQALRAPGVLLLVVAHALVLLSLAVCFGLSGSRAPVAVVLEDASPQAQAFLRHLRDCHHSFAVETCDAATAQRRLAHARISAIITIPADFANQVARHLPVVIACEIDNVNADLSEDIRRALPAAIVAYGCERDPADISVRLQEQDRCVQDTGFIAYLASSALALDALAISAVLAALVVVRDRENHLHQHWDLAPLPPGYLLFGRLLAAQLIAVVALVAPLLAVLALVAQASPGHLPVHAGALAGSLAVLVLSGGALGTAVGTLLPRSGLAAALILGLALACYLASGALEPQRFDGELIWLLAHATPAYPAVGLCEYSMHGVRVTPEPMLVLLMMLGLWSGCAVALTAWRFPSCVRP